MAMERSNDIGSGQTSGLLVAAIQYKPVRGALDHNRNRLVFLVRSAIEAGAELVVLPEMCTSGYVFPSKESILPCCETRTGRSVTLFQREAERGGVTLCFGWPELDAGSGHLFNSAAVCFPDGKTEFYRKNLLYEADEAWAEPGDTPYPMWHSKNGLLCSLGICMDLNDDRFIQHLVDSRTRVAAFPTNWLDQGFKVWNYWAWRLQDTKTCLVAANRYGTEDETTFSGDSAVLDGRTLLGWTEAQGDAVVLATIPEQPTPFQENDEN
jgi:predicted amidohydrolase